jgi:hypothetical protein
MKKSVSWRRELDGLLSFLLRGLDGALSFLFGLADSEEFTLHNTVYLFRHLVSLFGVSFDDLVGYLDIHKLLNLYILFHLNNFLLKLSLRTIITRCQLLLLSLQLDDVHENIFLFIFVLNRFLLNYRWKDLL